MCSAHCHATLCSQASTILHVEFFIVFILYSIVVRAIGHLSLSSMTITENVNVNANVNRIFI